MSRTKDLLASGNLSGALQSATEEVKSHPTDSTARTILFEILCFSGELDRALKQLDVIEQQRDKPDLGVQVYRHCLQAEKERWAVFAEGREPHFLSEPPSYVDLHVKALALMREGKHREVREILDRAEEERPAVSGSFNGTAFSDFRDYDDFTAPVLELVVHDKYTWLPFEQIRQLEVSPPKQLRDLLWTSARLITSNGVEGEVMIPALYAPTRLHTSDSVRLGRMTDWNQIGEELCQAVGLRLFLVDDQDRSLFEAQTVEFQPTAASEAAAPLS
ncbi:MAG: type VI secretion system accessory protein TagJ [Acidobacteriota bacterium]